MNRYRSSRVSAGITQERAAEMLGVGTRTLYDYENDRLRVPKDIVEGMASLYKDPILELWHDKRHSSISKYLPDVEMPEGNGDMAYQLILAQEELDPAVNAIKRIMANRRVDSHEREDFKRQVVSMWRVAASLLSVIIFAEQIEAENDGRKKEAWQDG